MLQALKFGKTAKIAMIILALLAAVGIGTWIYQLIHGLGITGMNNTVSWGLYIAFFMFFVGLSAGGLIVASSAHVFNIEAFKAVAIPAVICSTVCICIAGVLILVDLGGIQRIINLFTGMNFRSPLAWDVCVITAYLVVNILDLFFLRKNNHRAVNIVSRFALPIAILVHSVTAWVFGMHIGREGWHTAILAPIFVASACDSGLALLLVALAALDKANIFKISKELFAQLAGLLATFIAVDAFFIGCELLTMAYPGTEGAGHILGTMFSGVTSPFFWFEVIVGLLIPFLILVFARNREKRPVVLAACVMVILGVLCKRMWLLFTSFLRPNMYGAPGVTQGTLNAQSNLGQTYAVTGSYWPTLPEVLIVVGIISLGALAFMILSKWLCSEKVVSERSQARAAKRAAKREERAAKKGAQHERVGLKRRLKRETPETEVTA